MAAFKPITKKNQREAIERARGSELQWLAVHLCGIDRKRNDSDEELRERMFKILKVTRDDLNSDEKFARRIESAL